MDNSRLKAIKMIPHRALSSFIVLAAVVGLLGFAWEIYTAQGTIESYIGPLMMAGAMLGLALAYFKLRHEFTAQVQEHKLQLDLSLNREITEISRQVADDIRGPLTALTTLSQLSHEMSPEKKDLLQVAVARIRGITEELLKRGKIAVAQRRSEMPAFVEEKVTSDLVLVTESLLKEYKFSHSQAKWTLHNHLSVSKVPVDLDTVKIQRILSKLLNNALEAAPEKEATIDLTLMERPEHFILQIMDNGNGIPEAVLIDARKTLESIGGALQIRAREGVGTQVILLFPRLSGPTVSQAL